MPSLSGSLNGTLGMFTSYHLLTVTYQNMAQQGRQVRKRETERERQDAPPSLEPARLFLQTWSIPNDTRVPIDQLASIAAAQRFQAKHFPRLAPAPRRHEEVEILRALRDDLRRSLTDEGLAGLGDLNPWLARLPITVNLRSDDGLQNPLQYRYEGKQNVMAGALLALAVEALATGIWRRLKVCPDCQTVFYDRTKNQNRVWCGMYAHGPGGRACGSISKVRNWRDRQKAASRP
jgi:predicted RNA-binding Zn ribbon-like protein